MMFASVVDLNQGTKRSNIRTLWNGTNHLLLGYVSLEKGWVTAVKGLHSTLVTKGGGLVVGGGGGGGRGG